MQETDEQMSTQIIFVQDKFYLGGIEVLELKLADELLHRGFNTVIASRANETLDAPTAGYTRFLHEGYPDFISRSMNLPSNIAQKVIFVSLHPTAAIATEIAARRIQRKYGKRISVHHFHWVSHSRAFFFAKNRYVRMLFEKIFFLLPVNSTYFMNDIARIAHQKFWRRSLEDYPVLRIIGREPTSNFAIEDNIESNTKKHDRPKLQIVSVGRLVPFKSYNVYAPIIIRKLRDAGVDATWDIWGYGPDEAKIASKAQEYEVNDFVNLRGKLPHELFDETVSSYDVFVGMGTALLEAAKTGMPVCVAVENQVDACYGHLHETPSDSVGDRDDRFPEHSLDKVLRVFSGLSERQRLAIGKKDAMAARARETTLSEFVTAILSAEPITKVGLFKSPSLSVGKLFLVIKNWKLERDQS
jgi:glycosyltransferase involved in cell wall biosynthesis